MRFSHIGFVVNDIERSINIWRKNNYFLATEVVFDKIQNIHCCLLEKDDELSIELVSPGKDGAHPLASRLNRGGGLDHICYEVSNLDLIIEIEKSNKSILVLNKTYSTLFKGEIVFFLRKSGLLVEYVEKSR